MYLLDLIIFIVKQYENKGQTSKIKKGLNEEFNSIYVLEN
jgi:hypothetical protein